MRKTTNDGARGSPFMMAGTELARAGRWRALAALAASVLALPAAAAEAPYPFEGTWVRAGAACTPTTVRERVYTAKDVVSPRGHCTIRRIASGYGAYELLEECRRNDRPVVVTETIRLTSPDSITLKRQLSRLKIPRQLHYVRCRAGGPAPPPAAPARPSRTAPLGADPKDHDHDHDKAP